MKDFEIKVSDEVHEKLLEIIDRLAMPPDNINALKSWENLN